MINSNDASSLQSSVKEQTRLGSSLKLNHRGGAYTRRNKILVGIVVLTTVATVSVWRVPAQNGTEQTTGAVDTAALFQEWKYPGATRYSQSTGDGPDVAQYWTDGAVEKVWRYYQAKAYPPSGRQNWPTAQTGELVRVSDISKNGGRVDGYRVDGYHYLPRKQVDSSIFMVRRPEATVRVIVSHHPGANLPFDTTIMLIIDKH